MALLTTLSELERESMSGLWGARTSRSPRVSFERSFTHSSAIRTQTGEPGAAVATSART